MYGYSPDIALSSADFTLPPGIGTRSFTVSYLWGEYSAFPAAVAIHTVPIFITSGTHCCWVVKGSENSEFVQGFYT